MGLKNVCAEPPLVGVIEPAQDHPREVFRLAIVTAASALIVMHNHPSGESTPSEADIKVTRDLTRIPKFKPAR